MRLHAGNNRILNRETLLLETGLLNYHGNGYI